jgi:hypothetical protein
MLRPVGRLTRQELGWLLTQEAQGAADRLRHGVQVLKSNPPTEGEPSIDSELTALDDAMRMLSTLHNRPISVRGRRGRIDLAAMLWELAPDAQLQIEPGSGTEVFGDEAELRRMLSLMIGHGSGTGSAMSIKREGDEVRVSVVLGPDSTASAETERAWLSRMAIRYGGTYELEGATEVVILPADAERKERQALEKELDEARKQGEAYARELAATFSTEGESQSPSTFPPPLGGPDATQRFGVIARFAGGIAAELRTMLSPVARDVSQTGSIPPPDRAEQVKKALLTAQEFVSSLAALGELDPAEPAGATDMGDLIQAQIDRLNVRIDRAGVHVRWEEPAKKLFARVPLRAAGVMIHQILWQAIASSPRGSDITVALVDAEPGPQLVVDDAGAPLPVAARKGLVTLQLEPGTYGRPTSIPLYVCAEMAAWLGASLELGDVPVAQSGEHHTGGVRVSVTFKR